jgi:hypothetical protein
MTRTLLLITVSIMLTLTGCASVSHYPAYKDTVKISISSEAPSTWTETPAGAVNIDNSQVIVMGRGGGAGMILLFDVFAIAVQKSMNASAVSDSESSFAVKFDTAFYSALQSNISMQTSASQYNYYIIKSEEIEDIWLRPSAWFAVRKGSRAMLTFQVLAKFRDASGRLQSKWYSSREGIRAISGNNGWSDNNATLFKQAMNRSLDRIAQVVLRDITGGRGQDVENSNQSKVQWQPCTNTKPVTSTLLYEQKDYYVILFGKNVIGIVDRALEPIINKPQ